MSEENSSVDNNEISNDIGEVENQEEQVIAPPVSTKKKYKFKSDGQEFEEEYDDESIARQLSLAKAAQKRMSEASMTKKQAESFIQALKNDPMKVLQDPKIMGSEKFYDIAVDFLQKHIEEQSMSPEERSQKEREARLRKYEEAEKENITKAEAAQLQKLEEHYAQEYEKTIFEAFKSSSLPKNSFTVKKMASLMQKNLEHGFDIPASALAQMVKEDYQSELASLIKDSDASQILAMFGEETVNKLRKYDLEKLRNGQPQAKRTEGQSQAKESRPMSMSEWRALQNR